MNCGYSFLVYLFRFLLLISELLVPSRLVTGFYDGCNAIKHCSEGKLTQSFKVLNRIFAVLVKANPSREMNYKEFGFYVKE